MFFLAALLLAAMFATLFILIKGLVNMAGTTSQEMEEQSQGQGPTQRALKSQKLMQQRILFQAVAIGVAAIILFAMSAKG